MTSLMVCFWFWLVQFLHQVLPKLHQFELLHNLCCVNFQANLHKFLFFSYEWGVDDDFAPFGNFKISLTISLALIDEIFVRIDDNVECQLLRIKVLDNHKFQ